MDRTATYTTTTAGDIVRRLWIGTVVYVAVLRVGSKRATLAGVLTMTRGTGAGGWLATGMLRALHSKITLGETTDYLDAEALLLAHRSGRLTVEPWEPPAAIVRQAAARAELARRRRVAAKVGGGVSIGDLFDDLNGLALCA